MQLLLSLNLIFFFVEQTNEAIWSTWVAEQVNGIAESRTPDGARIDVLSATHAIEVEWCSAKVYESVGQALYYQAASNRPGAVVLLMGRKPFAQEVIFYHRCLVACAEANLDLWVVDITNKSWVGAKPPGVK